MILSKPRSRPQSGYTDSRKLHMAIVLVRFEGPGVSACGEICLYVETMDMISVLGFW
jgi:hypothetical protein